MLRLVPCRSPRYPPALLPHSTKNLFQWNHTSHPVSRRSIFSLPGLSLFSQFGSESQRYHEHKILPYRPQELYDIVADVASYPRFVPFCTGSRVIKSTSQNAGHVGETVMDAELTVGFLAFKESYVSQVTCTPCKSVQAVASSSTPLFKTLSTTWRFQSVSAQSSHPSAKLLPHVDDQNITGGPTLVTLDLAYAFANPIHASVSSAFFGQVSKLMVQAFENRCIEIYGPGQQ
ncbi:dehydrase and lipid transport-domain-containing protein [Crucibulum laeve]|uniref:Dehydrase and lipid transport-domain-containing protein n=1 Tax=Crucibulum laeve TaxID=68775 RepID=A0A5C3MI08_9AGAR|nr:dehydrase and lipid transport-domain-containing protein [Crucibulum laeve]